MLKRKRIRIVVWRLAIIYQTVTNDSIIRHSLAYGDGNTHKTTSVPSSSSILSSSSSLCAFQTCGGIIQKKQQEKYSDNQHYFFKSTRIIGNQKQPFYTRIVLDQQQQQQQSSGIYHSRSVTTTRRYTLMNIDQEIDNDNPTTADELTTDERAARKRQLTIEYDNDIDNDNDIDRNQQQHYFGQTIPLPHFLDELSLRSIQDEINPFKIVNNFQKSNTNLDTFRQFFNNDDNENGKDKDYDNEVTSLIEIVEDNTNLSRENLNEISVDDTNNEGTTVQSVTLRSLWRRRDARSAEEGIRRERTPLISTTTTTKLSDVLDKARGSMMQIQNRRVLASRKFAARTISGIISALAENVDGLEVQVTANPDTPFWKKHVDVVAIQFSKLGFKPLQISGGVFEPSQVAHHYQARSLLGIYDDFLAKRIKNKNSNNKSDNRSNGNINDRPAQKGTTIARNQNTTVSQSTSDDDVITRHRTSLDIQSLDEEDQEFISPTADEAFDRIDVDNSGSLDRDELVQALNLAATASFEDVNDDSKAIIEDLAADLVELYDVNGDGVVDRKEYKSMVADMAELRRKQIEMEYEIEMKLQQKKLLNDLSNGADDASNGNPIVGTATNVWNFVSSSVKNVIGGTSNISNNILDQIKNPIQIVNSIDVKDPITKTLGSLTITDVKMDMRRLFFGALPVLKHITPGGPLILEPFTVTVNGSFNKYDILNSALLDAGLRRLVMRVLRIRVGFIRDFIEGSVFYGRSWRMFGEAGPKVEVPQLTEIEFDENDKLIITGRAKVRTSPNAPVVEQAFKVRTRIGTGASGRFIRLEEPELALVIECPKSWEKNFKTVSDTLNIKRPLRPKPIYSFFPIYSPFKLNDDSGFDLGEDNKIRSLYIHNGALCFEMTSILRPGRFLGSHYIAFSVPSRTFIVTLDRVKEGIRAARKTKKAAQLLLRQKNANRRDRSRRRSNNNRTNNDGTDSSNIIDTIEKKQILRTPQPPKTRGFFSRFVDGYLQAEKEDTKKEKITGAIRDFFGRQGAKLARTDDNNII